ncbi:3-oxoacyl-[acyl-carrier-protein] synthase III C-terminal domain-containing protein [Roseicyclus sp. F158]|uniref:3-oxoacyl-[acyl-carrier-protein] synthase III C-terminal domain-containing protein n=1 Tax=Tropicimonas omnivorans TaxID=3075590 RepID=A0ABU3DC20_9RHOB|nr:3-oxoacyl-[acyl-carrier-protein] synthase III C-terminal domain-containing protein [Roseicyclus sp. F158]MDT0681264.1 3-oxoacyl-[acyl-carrier-protein] synthase III C-terminal domain-containing protein [Roseicyclus sp. F158]
MPPGLLGTGHALPAARHTSADLDARLSLSPGTLEARSGVAARYHVSGDEDQISLGAAAARAALDAAGVAPSGIDLVLSASGIPYQTLPATAPLYMRALGIEDGRAAAYDVNATCLSFLAAWDMAARAVAAGQAQRALVISSEIASRALPWDAQPDVAALFGDGAAAAVIGPGEGPRFLMRTYPSAYESCEIGAGGTRIDYHAEPETFAAHSRFAMDGPALFRVTARHFRGFVDALLEKAGWAPEEIDLVVPHQASPHALGHMIRHMGLPEERVVDISRTHGNQIAASIPTALDIAIREGRALDGAKVLLLGTSAGVSFGGLALAL